MSTKAINKKIAKVDSVVADLQKAKSFVIFEYHGLTAKSITALRTELHNAGSKLYVLKNNILKRSIEQAGIQGMEEHMTGPNAIAISFEDEINPFKVVSDLKKNHDVVQIKTAFIENKVADAAMISQIASIPGREGLYSMLLSVLAAPIRGVMYALKAVSEKKPA